MQYKDYYQTLGVPRNATQSDIKRAYRRLARRFHPDVSQEPDAEFRFKEINEANEVLRDPGRRAAYDALGTHWQAGEEFRPPPGSQTGEAGKAEEDKEDEFEIDGARNSDFSEFFDTIFGRAFQNRRTRDTSPRRGEDHVQILKIDLEESYQGTTRTVEVDLTTRRNKAPRRTLSVRIPAGITRGKRIRLPGQGVPGRHGGADGDLYLEIDWNPHRMFHANGRDIELRLPIAPWEAALGALVQTPTLGGKVVVRIPPGSQSGQKLRLKGRGLPGEPPGDQIVELQIFAPPAETRAARAAYRAFAAVVGFDPRSCLE